MYITIFWLLVSMINSTLFLSNGDNLIQKENFKREAEYIIY